MATFWHWDCDTHDVSETSEKEPPKWVEREVIHARHVIANAKLVVTFSAALAGTFVSSTLDKTESSRRWDELALVFMCLTLLYTVRVILLRHRPHEGELDADVFEDAKRRADKAHRLMVEQVLLSLLTVIAVVVQLRI
jgi:hypothetical protein